jgi:hypothetical protein
MDRSPFNGAPVLAFASTFGLDILNGTTPTSVGPTFHRGATHTVVDYTLLTAALPYYDVSYSIPAMPRDESDHDALLCVWRAPRRPRPSYQSTPALRRTPRRLLAGTERRPRWDL